MKAESKPDMIVLLLLCVVLIFLGCDDDSSNANNGADADADTDTDTDTDADSDTDTDTDSDPGNPLGQVDLRTLIPPQGVTVTADYNPLPIQLKAPLAISEDDKDLMVEVDISASSTTLGEYHSVFSGIVAQGEIAGGQLDLSSLTDGEKITFMFSIQAKDAMLGMGMDVGITYGGSKNPVEVTGCLVESSHVGGELNITCDGLAPGGMDSLLGGWELKGAPSGATISDGKIARSGQVLEEGDVGPYKYSITATDKINVSDPLEFSAPVDEHASKILFAISKEYGDENHQVLMPENIADTIAQACGVGFDNQSKPGASTEAAYVLDLGASCVQTTIAALTPEESHSLRFYEIGQFLDQLGSWKNTKVEYTSAL